MLFLHGFMGNCDDFAQVISNLEEFCCLMVDLPGHGQTTVQQDSDYQMPNVAQALVQLLIALNIKQCILVGYSMGGRIALYLAIHFTQYFQGVILESASPGLSIQLERDRRIAQDLKLAEQLETSDLADFIQQWYGKPLFASFVGHSDYPQAIARRLCNDPYKLAKSLRLIGLGIQPSLWKSLPKIQIPLLLIVGELDTKFVQINQMMANSCPHATLQSANNTGHNVHFEDPFQFTQLLKDFIARLSSTID
ncbi:2-succinyl-6-hydroxy-2,4-cyclohexadiene-1-carboxylate synthase [Pleurocapsa sp. CCALA 161]|uniref:2-succinyl-6-hydroxy-2, 4-cyclohexadiene-1-carboxylate synthase n=1 Tax=Pleurocapsa sp. CCALA 161 TaxID=2107688 RepID=UPI002100DD2F|nr:2-succinyl-6-hydroxy-2,4-cyclohexadiene-1-carboxylate synthase [Pleurocapsa sp. CCALA 161]